jgi:hypothetical protein
VKAIHLKKNLPAESILKYNALKKILTSLSKDLEDSER